MSRVTKWKLEKAKVKVVFRLQFHATHIPQSGWEKLFISFIPTETGKATAKTSKANVRNGTCKWADPIYETTRLLLDSKSKQYDDKLYKLVVGMGTSRSSILGEATINLADYADASQPSALALPLHGSDHGTILHVTVQLLTAKTGFREFEQQRDKGLQRETEPSIARSPSSDLQIPDDQLNKGKTQRQLKSQSRDLLIEETRIHEEYSDSQVTCDDSSNTSESFYADKHDSSSTHEVDSVKNRVSMNNDLAIAYEENQRLRGSLEVAESSISELKIELSALQTHANEMGTETQKLAQELAEEIASSQELAKEVTVLKSECLKFKNDLQQLKEMKSSRIPSLPLQEPESIALVDSTEGQNSELLDFAKGERESLVRKMNQMECYYESLVQELEENQKRILGEFQSLRNEHSTCKAENESIRNNMNEQMLRFDQERCELSSINKDLQKRATTSESALKRARLNYSIAVSQLQKDLDMLSFQVLSMFETNQTVIKEAFSDSSQEHEDLVEGHRSKHLSGDLKKSLSLQENIYKKVEEELGEMCSANLYLDVYSGTLSGTLLEASDHIRKTKEKLQELAHELEVLNQSRDVLFMRLQTVSEDFRAINAQNSYHLSKCNDLEMHNQMLEADLGSVSRENFLLMEKITECEALLMDYKVYKSKHEVVSAEKLELESVLKLQVYDNQNLEKDMAFMKKELETLRSQIRDLGNEKDSARSELDDVKRRFKNGLHEMVAKLDIPSESLEKIQFQLDSVSNKLKNSLESDERHVENTEAVLTYLSSMELELQKISSEDKNFIDQIMGLDTMIEEFEKSKLTISEMKQENQDCVLEINRLKECLRFVKDELGVEKTLKSKLEGTISSLTSELESQRLEVGHVRKLASDQESENSRNIQLLAQNEESLETQLAAMHEIMICEDLKLVFIKSQYETQIEELVKQCKELEKKNLDKEARLNQYIASEAQHIQENKNLSTTLESFRLELQASVAHNAEILESNGMLEISLMEVSRLKDRLAESEAEVGQLKELQVKLHATEAKLNAQIASEAHYIEENEKLSRTLKSVRLKLDDSIAHNAKISESNLVLETSLKEVNNQHTFELGQLKDMLVESEARLKHSLENEDRYVKDNGSLATELETVRLELEEMLESKNVLEGKVGILEINLKDMLAKSESEVDQYEELQMKLQDTEAKLNARIASEACYIEENEKLTRTLESIRLELDASIVRNAEILESKNVLEGKVGIFENRLAEVKNQHAVELLELKDMLEKSELEVEHYKELQMKLHDTELRLKELVESEACYIEENEKLSRTLESVRLELDASIARSAETLESKNVLEGEVGILEISLADVKNQHAVELSKLKDMLAKSELEVEQYKELQMKLHGTESRLKELVESEARYIEENKLLSRTLESVRSDMDASIAHNAKMLESNNVLEGKLGIFENNLTEVKNQHAVELCQLKDMLAKYESEVEQYKELEMKLHDAETKLNGRITSEPCNIEENEKMSRTLESVQLKLDDSEATNELETKLLDTEERLDHTLKSEARYIQENESLRSKLDAIIAQNTEERLFLDEESEIVLVVLKAKLDEQSDELIILKNKCHELTNKLSEQILKTEEFKNLSIYLKELKDNADVAREKKDPEGPSESLRMAFIKEQHQAKLQELKQQLSVSKRHGEEMLFKLQDALDEIENRKKSEASQLKRIEELEADKYDHDRIQAELECAILSLECCKEEKEKLVALLQESEEEKSKISEELSLIKEQVSQKEENGHMGLNGESKHSGIQDEENSLVNDSKQLMVVNDQFRAQHLRSCMDQLNEELEKLKNDNSILTLANHDPGFQDIQREFAQLQKANEELTSIYPNFVDFSGNGNALERVLALEIELAEALRTKKKSSIQFQSSFLKQHGDEEAVFKSFRDINELIKDMLEIKGKYVNVENELKEMHDRYSQLSLQFAEVEGERQKLMMTLKNVRSSRNLLRLNRPSMAAIEDRPL